MIVRLLGPVEVVGPLGRAVLSNRQRALVGLLALQAGSVVVLTRVVDALWGEDPPRTAVKSLHSHVARVRQALRACGLADVLLTQGAGYTLALSRFEIDICRFEDDLRAARDELAAGRWSAAAHRLRTGLALWRGEPIQDGALSGWGSAEVTRLQELRLTAWEDLWDAELRLGHHEEAVGELDRLLVRYPLRERLVRLLMLALYRCGRPLDALEAYQRMRGRLAHELGVDPAPELRDLHAAILRHDPRLAPLAESRADRPAQLPPPVGHFTGRAAELRALELLLDGADDSRIAVISGPGGMGKTALAVHWAHRARDRFPDGQVFLDLRGRDDGAVTAVEALTHVLRSLGVPGGQVSTDLAELTNLFRSAVDGKRLLLLLDNGGTVDQIRPLVPTSATSALVVTTRRPLTALATYHAVRAIHLDALDDDEAVALLRSVVGADRVDREHDHAATIADCCGRMPLALRIAAATLSSQPHRPLKDLASALAGRDRLDTLTVDDDTRSVRAVFESTYRTLPPPAARLFGLIGLHPGRTFGGHLAAAVAGLSTVEAEGALAELVRAYLIAEVGPGRFRCHDLIRLYAAECARADPGAPDAVDRLIDWYLGVADAANRALDRGRDHVVPSLRHPLPSVPFAANHRDTLAFLDGERDNLPAVVRYAADQGRHEAAWQLTYLLTGFFDSRGRWTDRVEICRLGLGSAQRLGDPAAESLMRSGLGIAYMMTRRFDEALDCLYPALELARTCGDRRREGLVRNNIATAYAGLRRFDEALEAYAGVLEAHRAIDDRLGTALAHNNIGACHIRLGRPELSFVHLRRALTLIRQVDNPRMEAGILSTLGEAYQRQGHHEEALDHLGQALDIRRAIGDRRREVETHHLIGASRLARGEHHEALDHVRTARWLSHDLADQHLVAVCLTHLAAVHLARGELDDADDCLGRALTLRARAPDAYEEAAIFRVMADLARRRGQHAVADEHRRRAIRLYEKANAGTEAAELVVVDGAHGVGVVEVRAVDEPYAKGLPRLGLRVGDDLDLDAH